MFNSFRNLRKKLDTQSNTGADLQRTNSITNATNSTGKKTKRSRSKSLTKRLPLFGSDSDESLGQNSYLSSTSDYINNNPEYAELTRFKSLNCSKFNKAVLQYLKFHGLSAPKIIYDSSATGVQIAFSSSGENVFLPSLVILSDEERMTNYRNYDQVQRNEGTSNNTTRSELSNQTEQHPVSQAEETYLPYSGVDETVDPILHTLAVIVSLTKQTPISTISARLETNCKIRWPKGLPSNHGIKIEHFEIANMNWDLDLSNYNYFVPYTTSFKASGDAISSKESVADEAYDYDSIDTNIDEAKFMTDPKIRSRVYELKSTDQVAKDGYSQFSYKGPVRSETFIASNLQRNSGSLLYSPGDYIFLLPVKFPPSTPESLITENSSVSHILRTIIVPKGNKTYFYGDNYVNILRGPPVAGITTADKPVYVNKVWSESLNYEISFPKKYVAIGSEIPLKMKFSPLKKNISIKKIKVNILEYASYASKDLRYEYDEQPLRNDPNHVKNYKNQRVIPLLEINSHARPTSSIREEIVDENLLSNQNLISSCYESIGEDYDEIIGPLQVYTHLSFVKPQRAARYYTDGKNLKNELFINLVLHNLESGRKKIQVNKQLQTRLFNQGVKISPTTKINQFYDGLFADSINNRYINISHKLQITLRITRKLEDDGKIHNYEVMIETPLILLNSGCIPESVELPAYDGDDPEVTGHLPTFEEATSPAASPHLGPISILSTGFEETNLLTRTSTIGNPGGYTDFKSIDDLIDPPTGFTLERRTSKTRSDLLNSLKRITTQDGVQHETQNDSDNESIRGKPPSYNELEPLLSDAEGLESLYNTERRSSYLANFTQSEDVAEKTSTDPIDHFKRLEFE